MKTNAVRLLEAMGIPFELRGHADCVHAVGCSLDGTRLVSGSGDYTVRVWDALSPAARAQRADAKQPPG